MSNRKDFFLLLCVYYLFDLVGYFPQGLCHFIPTNFGKTDDK